jgi:hypothetical protein
MSIDNRPGAILILPFKSGTIDRVEYFYNEIGWQVIEEEERQFLTYWHTQIAETAEDDISMPALDMKHLVEVSLIVPANKDVDHILRLGGRLLQKNVYEFPDRSSDCLGFRFTDPFNYRLAIRSARKAGETVRIPDSKYVTTFTKWSDDEVVPVVSPENFVNFAIENGSSSLIARKAFRSIVTAAARDPEGFDEYIERSEGQIVGLNPIKIKQLIALIEESKNNPRAPHFIINFGPKAFQLLGDLAKELFPEE